MSPRNHRRCALALAVLMLAVSSAPAANLADLRTDWSNSANPNPAPNGIWAYTEALNPLPFIPSWIGAPDFAGWGPAANVGGNFLPFYYKATDATAFDDSLPGDVLVHSTDNFNGIPNGPGIYTWTSAVSGTFTIHGMFWPVRRIGRINTVTLQLVHDSVATTLASEVISEENSMSRCNPARVTLPGVAIVSGDVLRLSVIRMTAEGDFVGVNLAVSTGPCPTVQGDLNNDGIHSGLDIAPFTNCLLNGVTNCGVCACADMDGNGTVNAADVPLLVDAIL